MYFAVLVITISIVIRPLFFIDVGDFKIYLDGSEQALKNIDLYAPERENFGKRYFNGPILAWVNSPFLLLPEPYALFSYRLIGLICTLLLVILIAESENKKNRTFLLIGIVLLSFASRMNLNLAQGAAIAALSGLVSLRLIFRMTKPVSNTKIALSAFLFSITFNYKPQLTVLALCYVILVAKQYRFLFYFLSMNLLYECIFTLIDHRTTYMNWFQLLLERHSRMDESGSQDVVGPYAMILSPFQVPIDTVYFLFIFLIALFMRTHKFRSMESNALWLLGMGTFLGPYSPAQDSLLFTILFISWISTITKEYVRNVRMKPLLILLMSAVMSAQTLSTEISLRNSIIIALCMSIIVNQLKLVAVNSKLFLFSAILISWVPERFRTDHISYDVAGFSTLLMALVFVASQINANKLV